MSTRGVKGDHFDSAMAAAFSPLGDEQQNLTLAFGEAELRRLSRSASVVALSRSAWASASSETPHEFDPAIVPNPECAGNEQQKRENG